MESNSDISLCKNCWCMTHTLVGNVCGKCKRPKHIIDVIGDGNIGGESMSLKEMRNREATRDYILWKGKK